MYSIIVSGELRHVPDAISSRAAPALPVCVVASVKNPDPTERTPGVVVVPTHTHTRALPAHSTDQAWRASKYTLGITVSN